MWRQPLSTSPASHRCLSLALYSQAFTAGSIFRMEEESTAGSLKPKSSQFIRLHGKTKFLPPGIHMSDSRKDCNWSFLGQVPAHESVTLAKTKGDSIRPGLRHNMVVCKRRPYYQQRKDMLNRSKQMPPLPGATCSAAAQHTGHLPQGHLPDFAASQQEWMEQHLPR